MRTEAPADFIARAASLSAPEKNGAARTGGSLNARAKRIQELVTQIGRSGDPQTRALVQEILQNLLQLHGMGLERIIAMVAGSGGSAKAVYERLLNDEVVRGLLLIHDLHPVPIEERMQQALAKVLPYIRSHGGNVELVSLVDGIARLRLEGTCKSCSASSVTLELAVRAAIEEFCPDLIGFDVVGIEEIKVPPPSAVCAAPEAASVSP
jgi:Fe-S cluster biogenesis protein NfuA